MFAQIYTGCKCGETWRVTSVDHVDTERDKVYGELVCAQCFGGNLKEKVTDEGVPYYHALTHEEIMWEIELGASEEDEEDFYYTCSTCGGEFWDGGTSCSCEDWEDGDEIILRPEDDDFFDDLPY